MRALLSSKLLIACALASLLLAPFSINAEFTLDEATRLLPDQVGEYRAGAKPFTREPQGDVPLSTFSINSLSTAGRAYISAKGERYNVLIRKLNRDSEAYSVLTNVAQWKREKDGLTSQWVRTGGVGTASVIFPDQILFFKGTSFVSVSKVNRQASDEALLTLARLMADSLDKGDGDVPVLVKHLPEWERAQERALYATSLSTLKFVTGNQPVLDAVSFEGGAEAVTTTYAGARLVIVENSTPQLAADNDARIAGRIRELREQNQPVPTAYQRVGNYAVFVFDGTEGQAAELMKAISYEQVVQWLGDNPRALERAQRQYTQTTASIILAVLKASGLSILLCLGIGGLFGAMVFRRRRAQAQAAAAYSDAGDMVRLNLDGMSAQTDPSRLLGRGES